jgi:hypothetical protein
MSSHVEAIRLRRSRFAPRWQGELRIISGIGAEWNGDALCHLPGFRFAPRIRDLADKRPATIERPGCYPALVSLLGRVAGARSSCHGLLGLDHDAFYEPADVKPRD